LLADLEKGTRRRTCAGWLGGAAVTQRPTLAQEVTIDQWWKNRSHEAITISMSTYQGKNVIDIRVWQSTDGRLRPTKKGITTDLKHLRRLARALNIAVTKAIELDLIDAEGDQ
jgi:hypothetical protein